MKVIFLDVDGVLNTESGFLELIKNDLAMSEQRSNALISYPQMRALRSIVDRTGAKVVLSSTWRIGARGQGHRLAVYVVLTSWGIEYIGQTTTGSPPGRRGGQINQWLEEHPEVANYVILDDDSDMLPTQLPYFVQTRFVGGGLTEELADRAVEILNQ